MNGHGRYVYLRMAGGLDRGLRVSAGGRGVGACDRESAMFGMQLRPLGAVAAALCLIVSLLHNAAPM